MLLPLFRPPGDPGLVIAGAIAVLSTRLSEFTAASNLISQVTDVSTNADHAVQATGADQPTLDTAAAPGTRAMKFSATDHLEQAPGTAIRAVGLNIFIPGTIASERPILARAGSSGSNPAIIATLL